MVCVNMGQPLQCVNMISDVRVVVFCLFLILIRHPFDQTRLTNSGEKISRAEKEKRPFFMGYMWWSKIFHPMSAAKKIDIYEVRAIPVL